MKLTYLLSFTLTRRFVFALTLSASLGGLVACGSNESAVSEQAKISSVNSESTAIVDSQSSPLLRSLGALFPNGKIPVDISEQAAVERLQGLGKVQTAQNASVSKAALSPVSSTAVWSESGETSDTSSTSAQSAQSASIRPQAGAIYGVVSRVQNTSLYGAYFFTIYPTERSAALSANPNWGYEGPAFSASLTPDVDLFPVHRFRNLQNGSYLYSIYEAERSAIVASYSSTFLYEGVSWYARQTAATGWKPLYRFRNVTNGTYLFSAYEAEKDAILANYPAVFQLEGVAYYVKEPDAVDKYVGMWSKCISTGQSAPAYETLNLTYSKAAPTALNLSARVDFGYSDSQCKNKTHINNDTAPLLTGTVALAGTKSVSGKTVDKMYTVLSTGATIGDIYFLEGNKLYTGGGTTDAMGYLNSLATFPYILQ